MGRVGMKEAADMNRAGESRLRRAGCFSFTGDPGAAVREAMEFVGWQEIVQKDARVAIKTLFYRVMAPEKSIEQCFEEARRDLILDVINDLSDANLIILGAAATGKSNLARDIYQRYCRYGHDHGIKPFSYVYFYANLGYLQSVGLLALIATKVERAYANRVLLTFDKSIAEQICRLRFE